MSNWAWIDVETTGVDLEKDIVLEVAVVVTTPQLEEIASIDLLIGGYKNDSDFQINPFVLDLHTRNGLWKAIADNGVTWEKANEQLGNFFADNLGGRKQLIQAGSGVSHFDSKFVAKFFPEAAKLLTFWTNDAAVLKRAFEQVGLKSKFKGRKDTRGLEDCRAHIKEWKHYIDLISQGLEFTTTNVDRS